MADMQDLLRLADAVAMAQMPLRDRTLNRAVARAVGWGYRPPAQMGRKNPGWFHPDDCRDGVPVLDSLHGTDVWREPLDYLGSFDAAMSLIPIWLTPTITGHEQSCRLLNGIGLPVRGMDHFTRAATLPLAITAAALKARAHSTKESDNG